MLFTEKRFLEKWRKRQQYRHISSAYLTSLHTRPSLCGGRRPAGSSADSGGCRDQGRAGCGGWAHCLRASSLKPLVFLSFCRSNWLGSVQWHSGWYHQLWCCIPHQLWLSPGCFTSGPACYLYTWESIRRWPMFRLLPSTWETQNGVPGSWF